MVILPLWQCAFPCWKWFAYRTYIHISLTCVAYSLWWPSDYGFNILLFLPCCCALSCPVPLLNDYSSSLNHSALFKYSVFKKKDGRTERKKERIDGQRSMEKGKYNGIMAAIRKFTRAFVSYIYTLCLLAALSISFLLQLTKWIMFQLFLNSFSTSFHFPLPSRFKWKAVDLFLLQIHFLLIKKQKILTKLIPITDLLKYLVWWRSSDKPKSSAACINVLIHESVIGSFW